jgi:hypothetical protein
MPLKINPMATPINAPITITSTKLSAAHGNGLPVITAAKAKRYTIREDASLSKLSPSTILTSNLGAFTGA